MCLALDEVGDASGKGAASHCPCRAYLLVRVGGGGRGEQTDMRIPNYDDAMKTLKQGNRGKEGLCSVGWTEKASLRRCL